ncbi:hypothetical protein FA15DRAFT_665830 [Coprinopsis marcescibilis]|uniref:ABM domain-containing protein n=1 Tax=Coprinopsis marcescibilis TaxID=230819 RepID=A0A5C3L668_COPMA|nr:hypothetical protein FA15DRAFT_665830 [Coprinopsis marcescibilis]
MFSFYAASVFFLLLAPPAINATPLSVRTYDGILGGPCVDIIRVPSTSPFTASLEQLQGQISHRVGVQAPTGLLSVHAGRAISVDNSESQWIVFVAMQSCASTPAEVGLLQPQQISLASIRRIELDVYDPAAFDAPVTEIAFLTFRPETTPEQIEAVDDAIRANADQAIGSHPPSIQGNLVDHPGEFGIFIGWDSREAHAANGEQSSPEFIQLLNSTIQFSTLSFSNLRRIV